ncbi:hypothetical protein GCM10017566_01320 [Amycolatopsis bartoniae]|uniref:PRC-barrel domain containing protein n=1 Tax=Amycolatopsis bartoniae TaxID=941986 RepID=A0A8H9IM65_9PSEU|nr:hypothetical protein GCM10017566_01320 [Amycolatopsis bartoniae]
MGCRVFDRDGREVGHVHDLVFRRIPPRRDGDPPRFDLIGLECGKQAIGDRLGYVRGTMAGPWPLPGLFRWLARRSLVAEWSDVASIERPRIILRKRREELAHSIDFIP